MKIVSALIVAMIVGITTVSAATGSTSAGSTSTGTTSTGVTVSTFQNGAGGPVRAFNYTTSQYDLYPQCFPWAWLLDFYKGNIFIIYENQRICREKRTIDFRF